MPNKIGFLFPGQGAQVVGMGKDFYERFPDAKKIFDQADRILSYSLSQICFEGPEEKLTRTCHAQPAIFVTSLAALAVLKTKYPELKPSLAAGLSLGEFTALVAVQSLSFEEGLKLVDRRARAMEKSAANHPGTMASILGLTEPECQDLARDAGCEVANLNAPNQVVISGTAESIEKACSLAESRGAKRAIPLKVGGAFHSSIMKDAEDDLRKALLEARLQTPACLFVANVTGQTESRTDRIQELLGRQLTSPVQWSRTMKQTQDAGIDFFVEIGPGKVLKGLARSNNLDALVHPLNKVEDLEKLEEIFAAP